MEGNAGRECWGPFPPIPGIINLMRRREDETEN
jgi:hypothetical protein